MVIKTGVKDYSQPQVASESVKTNKKGTKESKFSSLLKKQCALSVSHIYGV